MRHQLIGNLPGEHGLEPASDVDGRQFLALPLVVRLQLRAFQLEVGFFGVGLRVHRHVFTRRHRHRSGDQAGDPRHHHVAVRRMGGCHTEHQAGRREDAIVGAQYRRAQPGDASGAVPFSLAYRHSLSATLTRACR